MLLELVTSESSIIWWELQRNFIEQNCEAWKWNFIEQDYMIQTGGSVREQDSVYWRLAKDDGKSLFSGN